MRWQGGAMGGEGGQWEMHRSSRATGHVAAEAREGFSQTPNAGQLRQVPPQGGRLAHAMFQRTAALSSAPARWTGQRLRRLESRKHAAELF